MKILTLLSACLLLVALPVVAAEKIVVMNAINDFGIGKIIGIVKLSDSDKGLVIEPDLGELPRGTHGFHVHEKANCDVGQKDGKTLAGLAAGGHFDPAATGRHAGPHADGHLGDLPPLEVGGDGSAERAVIAPQLKVNQIIGRSLMIHEGGDNFSDSPKPLGGGGARIACGVIE